MTRKVTELCDEWSHSNQHDQLRAMRYCALFCPIHRKVDTIGSLTSLGKIAISPVCNIQIGWNKRHSKVNTFVTLIYVSFAIAIAFYLHQARVLLVAQILGHPVFPREFLHLFGLHLTCLGNRLHVGTGLQSRHSNLPLMLRIIGTICLHQCNYLPWTSLRMKAATQYLH